MTSPRVALSLLFVVFASAAAREHAGAADEDATESFEVLSRRATVARETGRLEDAIHLYKLAVERRPLWDEGLWYLGTLFYETDRFAEALVPFRRFVELKPDVGPGWALLGLCQFEVGDHAAARRSLEKALSLGTGNQEVHRNVQWRRALVLVKDRQFERALEPLTWLAQDEPEIPGLEGAIGLMLLRRPMLPSEVPEADRDLVGKMGRAGYLYLATREDEAEKAFSEVVDDYPDVPWVHHAHGVFLRLIGSDRALAEFRRELEVQPTNVYALLEIAFELLLRHDAVGARGFAEKAVRLAPDLFAARHALGRALVELDQVDEGIAELERAALLAPEVPEIHFALQQAYARAGRREDMQRARARFVELERRRRVERGAAPPEAGKSPES